MRQMHQSSDLHGPDFLLRDLTNTGCTCGVETFLQPVVRRLLGRRMDGDAGDHTSLKVSVGGFGAMCPSGMACLKKSKQLSD